MDMISRRQAIVRAGGMAALAALPGALAACVPRGKATKPAGGDAKGTDQRIPDLVWAVQGAIPSLDVATGWTSSATQIQVLALEGLISTDTGGRITPRLAESWTQADVLTYVYKIRQGVKFWDGTPLTVEDVHWSMARHLDPKLGSQIAQSFHKVKSIEVTGPAEITVRLKEPDPEWAFVPSFTFVTPKAFSERLGKKLGTAGTAINTMGTGPYRVVSFDSDTGATLVRNPNYWGGAPGTVDKATFKVITDPNDLSLGLQSGDLDGCVVLATESLSAALRSKVAIVPAVPIGSWFLAFNLTKEPWSDIHVRRAFAHAADRAGYVRSFLRDFAAPSIAMQPTGSWGQLAARQRVDEIYKQIPTYPFDLAAARRELAQSKFPNGFSATVEYGSALKAYGKVLVSLSQSLKQIGIDLKVKETTDAKWLADLYAHNQGITATGLVPVDPDPSNLLNAAYLSDNAHKNGLNSAEYKNPEMDRLLHAQAAETDKNRRADLLGQALRLAAEDLPYLPLWWQGSPVAINRKYVFHNYGQLFAFHNWLADLQVRA